MSEARQYIVPAMLATLLHAALVAVMVVGFAMPRPQPITPLAIQATLVVEQAPQQVERQPEPETEPVIPEPEPELPEPEPEPEQPDPEELARIAAEEAKREEDARIERERIAREKAAEEERQRQAEEEARRKREAEEQRKREAEEKARRERELEERRRKAEEERQREIERQRQENERRRQEAEAALQAELDAESELNELMGSTAMQAYVFAIQQKIERNWAKPASAEPGLECEVNVRQLPGGDVVNVSIGRCNGDEAVRRSIEAAVNNASPLPEPSDPRLFNRSLNILFKPEQ